LVTLPTIGLMSVDGEKSRTNVMSKAAPARLPANIMERLAAARAGDEAALEAIIRQYQDRVAGYVVSRVGHNADFDDLCQLVFVKMALSLPKLRSLDVFERWLFKIARNVCQDHVRRLRFRDQFVPLLRDHEAVAMEPPIEASHLEQSALDAALKKLTAAQRELINLIRGREYSYEELACVTKSSVRAVAGRLFRARCRLRTLLRCDGAER
jgi:RNA polymerase sigma-70 factor, ECF subfamily